MDNKPRKTFTLWGKGSDLLGYGIYYPHGGNVQLFLKSSGYFASMANLIYWGSVALGRRCFFSVAKGEGVKA